MSCCAERDFHPFLYDTGAGPGNRRFQHGEQKTMKNGLKLAIITVSMAFLAACSSPEYVISTNDGTMIPTNG